MKIKALHIGSYRHLQNVHFDFTYPEGHAEAGKPLKKNCLIGQSATGKTSVLELVRNSLSRLKTTEVIGGKYLASYYLDFNGRLEFLYDDLLQKDNFLQLKNDTIKKNSQEFPVMQGSGGGSVGKFLTDGLKLAYLSAEIISKDAVNIFNQNPLNILEELATEKYARLQEKFNGDNYVYEFGQEVNLAVWFSLLYKVLDYRKRFTQLASELINKGAIGDFAKLSRQFEKWSASNENPLISFAHSFNPLLQKLNLEIDLISTEYSIPIKSKAKDEVIPVSSLSTGTKGLLLSMFPLHELDTTDAVILLDEPERSLFPDVQVELMSYYQRLAPDAQFIVATHSPFIAAAFEPEERFILYFDDAGKVGVRRGKSPIGDDPNDILRNDFKVDYYNDFGQRAYQDYLNLLSKLTQEKEPERKKELLAELTELGDKYNF